MSNTKLTLSVEQDTVAKAKKYASKHNKSVSKLFSELINEIVEKDTAEADPFLEKLKKTEISPKILALTGILKGKYPDDFDYRDAYREHLSKKHGL